MVIPLALTWCRGSRRLSSLGSFGIPYGAGICVKGDAEHEHRSILQLEPSTTQQLCHAYASSYPASTTTAARHHSTSPSALVEGPLRVCARIRYEKRPTALTSNCHAWGLITIKGPSLAGKTILMQPHRSFGSRKMVCKPCLGASSLVHCLVLLLTTAMWVGR